MFQQTSKDRSLRQLLQLDRVHLVGAAEGCGLLMLVLVIGEARFYRCDFGKEKYMLKDPFLNEGFVPDLMWFVGVFDVYDREETKGEELGVYDPNDPSDREVLIKK